MAKPHKCMENIGGQALIEGVMMRRGNTISSAIITDGVIKTKKYKIHPLAEKNKLFRLPFFRGIFSLFDMVYIGMKEMIWSANEAAGEGEDEEPLTPFHIILSIGLSIIFAVLIFKFLPLKIAKLVHDANLIGNSPFLFNLIDGLLRISLFVGYIYVISLIPDIKRVFSYHGAEHKAVNCFEHGQSLTVENARKFSTVHSRCGTSFLFIVLFFAIIIFSIVPITLPFYLLFLLRLPLLLPIAAVSYEILKLSSRYQGNIILRALVYPGLVLQRITTREPDKKQIEVALAALKPLIAKPKS